MMKVGITGGIGSGKSTVCRLFAQKGIAVYDSDAAAKRLMQEDGALRRQLAGRFGEGIFRDGVLDRAYLAGIVFADPQALADLNALVHPVVMRDFDAWAARQEGSYVILESAILFEAGLEGCVDKTVAVLAPRELRIERTCRRDGCGADQVVRRIAAQLDDDALSARADYVVVNIFEEDLEPAVVKLDRIFSHRNFPAALCNRLAGSYGNAVRNCVDSCKIHFFLLQDPAHGHKSIIHGIAVPAYLRENAEFFIELNSVVLQGFFISLKPQFSNTLIILRRRQNQNSLMAEFT